MKANKLFLLLAGLAACSSSVNITNQKNDNVEIDNTTAIERVGGGVKKASSTYTYTLPTDWTTKFLTGYPLYNWTASNGIFTFTDAKIYLNVNTTKLKMIAFNSSWDASIMDASCTSYLLYHGNNNTIQDDVYVAISPSPTADKVAEPTKIQFWTYGSAIKLSGYSAYFSGLSATEYIFNNLKFENETQYKVAMTGTSSNATVSGTDVPKKEFADISELKDILSEIGGSSYYKSVTSISFSSNSSSISGFTDTEYSIGTTKIYKNGNSVIFYDASNKTTAPSNISSLFSNLTALKTVDLSNLNTSKVTNFSNLFNGCTSLSSVDLSSIDMSNSSLTTDGLSNVFNGCSSLQTIVAPTLNEGVSLTLPNTYYDNDAKKDASVITNENAKHTLTNHKTHSLTKTEAKEATCNEEGNEEYYTCNICGALFSDSNATTSLNETPTIAKLPHSIEESITLSEDKKSAEITLTCKNDNKALGVVTSTSVSKKATTDPTCEHDGKNVYEVAYTFEGEEYTTTYEEAISKTGHSYKYVANLSEDGKSASIDVLCENENDKKIDSIEPSNVEVKEDITPATHFKNGLKTYTISFEYNGEKQTIEKEEEIPMLTDELTYECILNEDKTTGQVKITSENGGETLVDASVTSNITKESSCHEKGEKTYTFTFSYEGETLTKTLVEEIPLIAHDLEYEIEIIDKEHATVKEKCKNENGNIIKTDENVLMEETNDASGNKTYSININGETIDVTEKVNVHLKDQALASIRKQSANYDASTIKDENNVRDEINSLLSNIDETLKTYSSVLTESENNELSTTKGNLNACLTKLDNIGTELDSLLSEANKYDVSSVTSDDKSLINSVLSDAETFLSGNASNLTDAQKEQISTLKTNLNSCLAKISDVENSIASLTSRIGSYSQENVKSSDKGDIEKAIADIDSLLSSNNLTEEQKETLKEAKTDANGLISEINEISSKLSSLNGKGDEYSTSSVKTSDKADIEKALADLNEFKSSHAGNLTEEELNSLNEAEANLASCAQKITEVENSLESISSKIDGYDETSVKTSDKDDLNETKEAIEDLLSSNNLTDEEKTSLTSKKDKAQNLLKKIDDIEKEIDDIKDVLSDENATQEEKDEAIKKAQDLIDSGNLSENEVSSLSKIIEENNNQSSDINLVWLIILLSVLVLAEICFVAYRKISDKKNDPAKANSSLIPLFVVMLASGATGQIVACIVLGVLVLALAIYIVIDLLLKKKKK